MRIAFGALLVMTLLVDLSACGGNSGNHNVRVDCKADAECPADKPYCDSFGTCVECTGTEQCDCHEACVNGACAQIGAFLTTAGDYTNNAHGNWEGVPGDTAYAPEGYCGNNDECNFGELCNPFTAGCILATDYQEGCSVDSPRCPGGQMCDFASHKCLPAALCVTTHNCCGVEGVACGLSVPQVCERIGSECTPPEATTVTSICPFSPKAQSTCTAGKFCTPLGRCVQCLCDDDCSQTSGKPRCYNPTGLCVVPDFCTTAAECGDVTKACDSRTLTCKAACTQDTDCSSTGARYCDLIDRVCRNESERPCQSDNYEPNQSRDDAEVSSSSLLLPAQGEFVVMEGLTLCEDDQMDWYLVMLDRGDQLTIRATTNDNVSAQLSALAPDGFTTLATGTMDDVSRQLVFTADYADTYFVVVDGFSGHGTYQLRIDRQTGTPCDDTFETAEHHGSNNTTATATLLNGSEGIPSECQLVGTVDSAHSVTCSNEALTLCTGDVDYFLVNTPANSNLVITLTGFQGDLELGLYGPFFAGETVNTDRHADASVSNNATEKVEAFTRPNATYLVRVSRYVGGTTPTTNDHTHYDLTATVTAGPACAEDAFDAVDAAVAGLPPAPALVIDPALFNDTQATSSFVSVQPVGPETKVVVDNLSLCKGDEDWFRLGVEDPANSGTLIDIGANNRLTVKLVVDSITAGDAITLDLTGSPAVEPLGSASFAATRTEAFVERTDGGPIYLRVLGAPNNKDAVTYSLALTYTTPPVCVGDALGDASDPNNGTPATAFLLEAAPTGVWPSAAGQSHSESALSLCVADDDWYQIAVPADTSVVVSVSYEPGVADLRLALFNDTVLTATYVSGEVRNIGLLDQSARLGMDRQLVRGSATGVAYIMVQNPTGWPLLDYTLNVELIPTACFMDDYEDNNTWETAVEIPTTLVSGTERLTRGRLDLATICASNDQDWYKVDLRAGDKWSTRIFYEPSEGNLDLYAFRPGPGGLLSTLLFDFDNSPQDGVMQITYPVPSAGVSGWYLLKVVPYSPSGAGTFKNVYFVETDVEKACINDSEEPSSAAVPTLLSLPYDNTDLILCAEDDWYALNLVTDQVVTVCITFTNAEGNLDLKVYNPERDQAVTSESTTRDSERVLYTAAQDGEYYVKVFTGAQGNHDYTLTIQDGVVACP